MPSANEDITPWLVPTDQRAPDVYVIGFQEIVDLTTGNVIGTTDQVIFVCFFFFFELGL